MARTIDDKVVAASFESSRFEAGVGKTISALDRLKAALKFPQGSKSLNQLNTASQKVDFSHIRDGLSKIHGQFNNLEVVGIAVMATLATSAVSAGGRMIKAFTFQPVIDGLREYENQINSVQTILANTRSAGTNLKDVNSALDELNEYSDKTIYNFGQMTKNIGTFTAAGVDLETSVASIKGISNLAAVSGSSAEQAATAMYQLSQALSAGRVSLQDWNSVVNAGMGGTVFQRALAQTAVAMGTLDKSAVKLSGKMKNVKIDGESFRESITARPGEKSWLSSEVLTSTLKQFSGDLSKAELKAQGFNDAQIKAIQSQAKMALEAATQVKTFSQLIDTTKEALGSGWAQTWRLIFGDFGEAKTLFTGISNAIGGFVGASAEARNKVIKDWKALGGRKLLIDGLKTGFQALGAVLRPIKDAFRDIFPAKTGKDLFEFTKGFKSFMDSLKPSPGTVNNLRRTFAGFFAILSIGKQIIGGIFSVIGSLFGAVGDGNGEFLSLTATIGDWLVALDKALKQSDAIGNFFNALGNILSKPVDLLQKFAGAIVDAFDGATEAGSNLAPLQVIFVGIADAWTKFVESVSNSQGIDKIIEGIGNAFSEIGEVISNAIANANFDSIFRLLEVGLLAGLGVLLVKFFKGDLTNALSGGLLKSMAGAFEGFGEITQGFGGVLQGVTGNLKAFQRNTNSKTLRNIAISIALLAASLVALSLIDPKKLDNAISSLTIVFAELLAAMAVLNKIAASAGFLKLPVMAAGLIALAAAIDLLVIAVLAMSRLSWDELAKGLTGVAGLLAGISAASIPLSANSAGMIRAGIGVTAIAVAMNILARAVKEMGSLDMETLAKGLGGVVVAIAGIAAASKLFPPHMVAIGAGLIAIGVGVKMLSGTIERLGGLDMATLAKGIGAVGIAIAAIGLAMATMPPTMPITAAGLILVGVALQSITKAVGSMGGMSIGELAKGIGSLAAALVVLSLGLMAMSGSLAGAAALGVAAAGIAILTPALLALGQQSWGEIVKGLVALAAAFALLGVAGIVLAPVAPAILALGVALVAVGAGLALAGAGVALIGIGLASIAVAGPAAIKILIDALIALAEALPRIAQALVKTLVSMVEGIAKAAPKLVKALIEIIDMMAEALIVVSPKLATAFIALITAALKILVTQTPKLIEAGFKILKALLSGISRNIPKVTAMVATIVAKFLQALAKNIGKIITAGANLVVSLLKGIARNIGRIITAGATIITSILRGIGNNIARIVKAGADIVVKILGAIAKGASRVVGAGASLIVNFLRGIADKGPAIVSAAVTAVTKFIRAVARGAVKMADEGAKAVIEFLNGVARVIRTRGPEMRAAGFNIGKAIVQGMLDGLGSLAGQVAEKAKSIGGSVIKGLGKAVRIGSPSKATYEIGVWIVQGLAEGINSNAEAVTAANNLANSIVGTITANVKTKSATIMSIGKYLGESFYAGMLGVVRDSSQVITAFDELAARLETDAEDLRTKIDDARRARDEAREKHRGKAAARYTKAMQKYQADLKLLLAADKTLNKSLTDERDKLRLLVKDFEDVSAQLEAAEEALEQARSAREDAISNYTDQYTSLPGIEMTDAEGNPVSPADQLKNYLEALQHQKDAVAAYRATLDQLRAAGLDDATYKKLLEEGTVSQAFADALLAGGPEAIAQVNALDAGLMSEAAALAESSANNLYNAGVKAAEGLVHGLQSKKTDLFNAMTELANQIVKAIKKRLKIKSPSQEFARLGKFSAEGLAQGFVGSSKIVTNAATNLADDALTAMRSSISSISDAIDTDLNMNPVITPVLDLSQLQSDASKIPNIIPITAAASFGQASSISAGRIALTADSSDTERPIIKFEQNNHSPKALSTIDIYRQTKNQLAQAKQAQVLTP